MAFTVTIRLGEVSLALTLSAFAALAIALRTSRTDYAIGGLVLAGLGLLLGLIVLRRRREDNAGAPGLAAVSVGLLLFGMIFACLMPGGSHPGWVARRAQSGNNLHQVALALSRYFAANDSLPPAVVRDREGRPLYSWRVLILPYMEQTALYNQFHLDEPWDSPHNRLLLSKRPNTLGNPEGDEGDGSETYYLAFVGPGTPFEDPRGTPRKTPDGRDNFPDGLGRTMLVVEAARPVPWSKPIDLPFVPGMQLPSVGGIFRRQGDPRVGAAPSGFPAAFADGIVRWFPIMLPEDALRAAITRNGGEDFEPSGY